MNNWASYSLSEGTLDEKYVIKNPRSINFQYPCASNSSCSYYIVELSKGKYILECWGASGGKGKASEGGKGGYSRGFISLNNRTTFYVFIGGHGSTGTGSNKDRILGGFNGGGDGVIGSNLCETGSGGGATDIRKNSIS